MSCVTEKSNPVAYKLRAEKKRPNGIYSHSLENSRLKRKQTNNRKGLPRLSLMNIIIIEEKKLHTIDPTFDIDLKRRKKKQFNLKPLYFNYYIVSLVMRFIDLSDILPLASKIILK